MTLSNDIESIREKYALERARRIREDGIAQFDYTDGAEDPSAEPIERAAYFDHVDAIVIGGGVGGLTTAVRLRQAGLERIRIVERASDVGGTWYWNRYPGAQCDVESYVYIPLIEERAGYIPSEKYAYQPEIFQHCRALADKYDLYDDACFQTEVTEMVWEEGERRWTVRTNRGDEMTAQFVVVAGGFLQRPKLPSIPGIDGFEGKMFHTSRWNYSYTGGGPGPDGGGLPNLVDKRVAVVGTGATALQCVPPLGRHSAQLFVFQRTPAVVFERNNRPTDPEWASSLRPGWQAERINAFTQVTSGYPVEDVVQDGWTQLHAPVASSWGQGLFGGPEERSAAETTDIATMEVAHRRVSQIVQDPATAEALKPYYRIMCKRPSFHDQYLSTFNRPNVTLVDTAGRGLERVTSKGVVANGQEYEVDCLIFATGFDTGRNLMTSLGMEIVGRDGRTLSKHWEHGMRTFHGFHTNGFPNCFFVGLTQGSTGANFAHSLVEQANHVGHIVKTLRERGLNVVETTETSQDTWVETVKSASPSTYLDFLRTCTPSYYNNEGKPDDENRFGSVNFMAGPVVFYQMLADWRNEGSLEGLEIS